MRVTERFASNVFQPYYLDSYNELNIRQLKNVTSRSVLPSCYSIFACFANFNRTQIVVTIYHDKLKEFTTKIFPNELEFCK